MPFSGLLDDLTAAIGYFEDAYKLDSKNYRNMLELGRCLPGYNREAML